MEARHGLRGEYTLRTIDDWPRNRFAKYTGTDRKDGLMAPDGQKYLIKYAEAHARRTDLNTSYVNNVLSEYIASHILSLLGYDVHDTFLATRGDDLVVACRDFTTPKAEFVEFGAYLRKHYDSGDIGRVPSLQQIEAVLHDDEDLAPYGADLMRSYAERFIGDALVGNFDRHMGNWGYFVPYDGGDIVPAPIYDNGSTLFPALSEAGMDIVLSSDEAIMERTLLFPKAALSTGGEKVGYRDMLTSGYAPAFTEAVQRVVPAIRARLPEALAFLDDQPFLSDTRKTFYKTMLKRRMAYILEAALKACQSGGFDEKARRRITQGIPYTKDDFKSSYAALRKEGSGFTE